MTHAMDSVIERPAWRRPRWALAGLGLVALGAAAYAVLRAQEPTLRVERERLTVAPVALTAFRDDIPLRGKVVPRDQVLLDAAAGGRIVRLFVEAGDTVQAGQALLEFSNTSLQMQVIQQESQLNQALSQLQTNEITLEQNRVNNERALATLEYDLTRVSRQLARAQELQAQGFVSAAEVDRIRDELEDARRQRPLQVQSNEVQERLRHRQLPLIQEQQAQVKTSLTMVRGKLDELIVRSPVAGKVTDLDLKVGENRNAGDRLGIVVPDTGVKVTAQIDEYFLDRVRPDQGAQTEMDGKTWRLKVTRVYPQVKDGTFAIDLMFDGGKLPPGLLPGQAVLGRLTLGANRQALVLPTGGFLEHGGNTVFVVDTDGGSAHRRPVKLGRRTTDQVEVLEGLKAGDSVVTSDYTSYDRVDKLDIH